MFLLLIKENLEYLKTLGVKEGDIGTYSCRKGVTTMVAAGCTVSPTIVSIYIISGWVMGGVKEKYLKCESDGDQYVGGCASGPNHIEKTFAASPPYFDFSSIKDEVEKSRQNKGSNTGWMPDYCRRKV